MNAPAAGCHVCTSIDDVERIVHKDEFFSVLAIVDRPGWLMFAANHHRDWLFELSDAEAARLGYLLRDMAQAIRATTQADGVYYVGLGENSAHLHGVLTPRIAAMGTGIQAALRENGLSAADAEAATRFRTAIKELVRHRDAQGQ